MKRSLTISVVGAGSYDIQMDSEQRIATTLKVLGTNVGELASLLGEVEIREKRSGRKIETNQTYEEALLYTGAELLVTVLDDRFRRIK